MKKTDDPYKAMLGLYQNLAASSALQATAQVGIVEEPPPNLKIKWHGNILDSKFLYIDEYWLQGHERAIRGHIVSATQNRGGGSGDSAYESHNHAIDNDYTASIIYTDTWHKGDRVLMIPIVGDDNKSVEQFWILSKGRRLDGN